MRQHMSKSYQDAKDREKVQEAVCQGGDEGFDFHFPPP